MKYALFALKRSLGRPLFALLLLLCAAAIPLAGMAARTVALPSAGVYSPDDCAETQRITDYLLDNGFLLFDDPTEMARQVETGTLDCAAILPAHLDRRMTDGELEGCVEWIISPTSFAPSLFQSHLSAALYREYAPYLTSPIFEETEVTRDEVFRSYEQMFEEGYAFSFDVLTADGGREPARMKDRSLMLGAASILLCALTLSSCGELMGSQFREMLGRLGLKQTLNELVFPGLLVRTLLIAGAGCAGLLAAGTVDLIPTLTVYVFLLTGVGLTLAALLPSTRHLYVLLSVLVICSMALCPIFTDPALFSPTLEAVRVLLPTYWLWLIPSAILLWAAGAAAVCVGSFLLLFLRYGTLGKYRWS